MQTVTLIEAFCNYTTIGCCFFIKLPQLRRLFKTREAAGLSFEGVIVEYVAHLIVFSYNYVQGYALSSYFEYALLIVQDFLLIFILLQATGRFGWRSFGGILLSVLLFIMLVNGIPHPSILSILINFVIPIGASSKLMFIFELLRTRNASNVSALTWAISAFTCVARVITNSLKLDSPLIVHSTVSLVLCTVMCLLTIKFQKEEAVSYKISPFAKKDK